MHTMDFAGHVIDKTHNQYVIETWFGKIVAKAQDLNIGEFVHITIEHERITIYKLIYNENSATYRRGQIAFDDISPLRKRKERMLHGF